jgi:hypothetical protein
MITPFIHPKEFENNFFVSQFKNECLNSPRMTTLFNEFSNIASGNFQPNIKPIANKEFLKKHFKITEFQKVHTRLWGKFDSHFFASIPYILEEELRLGSTIVNYCNIKGKNKELKLYTMGTAEATMARSIGLLGNGRIKTLSCSPNKENKISFLSHGIPLNSFFHLGTFSDIDVNYINKSKVFNNGFDLLVEDTTFQMYSPYRAKQIKFSSMILKEDGIFISINKMLNLDIEKYYKREEIKDDFKKKHFSQNQIKAKNTILNTMEKNQVTLKETISALHLTFQYVVVYWNSTNFYSLASSNSKKNLDLFISLMPEQYLDATANKFQKTLPKFYERGVHNG